MQVTIDEHSGQPAGEIERFDEVKLETNEVARFVIPVKSASAFYVHELKPVLIVNGKIQTETKKRKDKTEYLVNATGFLGRRICTGVVEIPNPDDPEHPLPGPMRVKGVDPENCIVCAAAVEQGIADLRAELRYAVPVIRITCTGKGSTDIQEPPSAKIQVLGLTWRQYRDLAQNLKGIRELYGWGPEIPVGPDQADIVIKCEDAGFKRYQWLTPMRPHWRKDPGTGQVRNPALRAAIFGLWKNEANRPTEDQLQAACGRVTDIVFLQQDLDTVTESHADAKRIERGEKMGNVPGPAAETAQAATGLDEGLDDIDSILGEDDPPPATQAAPAAPADDGLDGLGEFSPDSAAAPANGHTPPAAAAPPDDTDLFDGAAETVPATQPPQAAPAAASAPASAAAKAAPPAAAGDSASFDEVWDEL